MYLKRVVLAVLVGILAAGSVAYGDPGPCADPDIVRTVKEKVICQTLVNCAFYGGYDQVVDMSWDRYRAVLKLKEPKNAVEAAIQKNGYRGVERVQDLISKVDVVSVDVSNTGRYSCRMAIYWNLPVMKPVFFSSFWMYRLQEGGIALALMGSDAGWSFLWTGTRFDERVYPSVTVSYGVQGDVIDYEKIGPLWDDTPD